MKPVTYVVPAHAPTPPIISAAGASAENDAANTRNPPVPITAKQNTVMRGRRPCNHSSVTTPIAAPKPSAVMSTPNAAAPPSSTSFAKLGPSGIIAPAPMSPTPRPSMTPRIIGCFPTNCSPSLISRKVSVQSMRLLSVRRSRRGIGRR